MKEPQCFTVSPLTFTKNSIFHITDNEQEEQIKKKSYTSFGKLILAEEKSKPTYSFGKAERFPSAMGARVKKQIQYYIPEEIPDVTKYKYDNTHKWRIGTAQRRPLNDNEKYSYFDHVYNKKTDLGRLPKKWNKIVGGAIGVDPRIKYDFREKTPGPGRYTPSYKITRPKSANYYIGEKTGYSSLKLFTGTDKNVGPGAYRPESAIYHSHHPKFPVYSIGKGKRKPLYNKPCAIKDTYWSYSSMGKQVQSKKKTEEMVLIGKGTRDREKLRGTFSCMMERQPVKIRIPMPKF